ncbi:MAG: alpha-glucosidase C-terminal domain-containing protein [Candidatus Eisenbacteria bacterium]|nr:alpha-glucosidase C-terminal domain-containing protein [Candidatus Eisenbacteria bacterium]
MRFRRAVAAGPAAVLLALLAAAALASAAGAGQLRKVPFVFRPAAEKRHAFLAAEFNGWSVDATPMARDGDAFRVVVPLAPGRYQYKFVADGEWITDETAREFHPDGFGGRNSVIVVDDSFDEVVLGRGDGAILTDGLGHAQRAWELAVSASGVTTFRVRAWAGDVASVGLVLLRDGRETVVPMTRFDSDGTHDYYTADAELPGGAITAYRFVFEDGGAPLSLGPNGFAPVAQASGSFRVDPAEVAVFETPAWAREAVFYQIFPERFANGDPSNDPDFSEWYYDGARDLPPSGRTNEEHFHLVRDWYDVAGLSTSPYRTDGKPDWYSFYGGDIAGVRRNLDYLSDLGVTAIYFNPLFEARSNHKYDAASYMRIDPHLGTNGEFAAFVRACHDRGIRVVMDLAYNHTGHTFWAFTDARLRGRASPTWDWYEWAAWPVPGDLVSTPPRATDHYDCWWGYGQMPNLNFDLSRRSGDEHGAHRIEDARPNWSVVEHLLAAAVSWLTEAGVDGFRLDVAGEVPPWFWELFRERVRRAKGDAYIVGELWGPSPEWVHGRGFDAVMNYKFFRDPVLDFIARGRIDAAAFDRALAPGRLIYPDQGVRAMMNLIGSHDTERFLTTVGGDVRKLKLAFLFAMTYVGAPTIYYGDEIAMEGGGDPDCRRPFRWTWREEGGRVEVRDLVRRLAAVRRGHACFAHGSFETLLAEGRVYAYRRAHEGEQAVVVLNAGGEHATVAVPVEGGGRPAAFEDALSGERVEVGADGTLAVTLPPLSGRVFVGER